MHDYNQWCPKFLCELSMQVIWKRLYKSTSARDRATMYSLRNVINRRNVVERPMKAVNACEEFFLLVVESHILTGAMSVFDMESADAVPKNIGSSFRQGVRRYHQKIRRRFCWQPQGHLLTSSCM